ncbi:MAG: hypothetical protein U1E67_12960 [Hyphomicrobiales bacterium]
MNDATRRRIGEFLDLRRRRAGPEYPVIADTDDPPAGTVENSISIPSSIRTGHAPVRMRPSASTVLVAPVWSQRCTRVWRSAICAALAPNGLWPAVGRARSSTIWRLVSLTLTMSAISPRLASELAVIVGNRHPIAGAEAQELVTADAIDGKCCLSAADRDVAHHRDNGSIIARP